MRWLVDGYNVIRRDPDLRAAEAESLEAGRRALLSLVAGVARRSPDRFTVVFDGAPGPGPAAGRGQVDVVFSRPPQTADDVLIRLAREAGAGAAVVSSDRRVRDAARRARCAVLAAEEFLAELGAPGEVEEGDKDEEAERAPSKRGNPRRLSRQARAAERARRHLRPH